MDLYLPLEPRASRRVPVDGRHTLHVEEAGNPDGVPVVFLHGGPGLAWSRAIYRFFDPAHYRIVAFDQRGTDCSTPLGELQDNTTAHLMADIEHLRGLLGIERWVLFGGSWGSALALAYALHHPERVMALAVARAYGAYAEVLCNNASTMSEVPDRDMSDEEQLATARISLAFFTNALFLPPRWLSANMHRLKGVPGAIAHGASDVICPPLNAWRLKQAWPDAELTISPGAGHSPFEEGTRQALVAAMERLKGIT